MVRRFTARYYIPAHCMRCVVVTVPESLETLLRILSCVMRQTEEHVRLSGCDIVP